MIRFRAGLAPLAFACLLAFGGTSLSGTAPARLPNSAAAASAPAIPAKIAIAAGFASLDEGVTCPKPGESEDESENLYLTVQNDGVSDLEVGDVTLLAPSDITLCESARTVVVPAGRRSVIRLPVGTSETPRPGTVPLLVAVDLTATVGGSERTDRLLASDKVELRIPGLSDVLKLLGVPTLFLLPGALVLGSYALFRAADSKRLAANTLGFWIVAVMISLAVSWLYTLVMSWYGLERDLTERFNLADVARVWGVSVGLGGTAGAIARWRADKAEAARARAIAERTLSRTDEPLELLERLVLLEVKWPPSWYTVGTRQGFLIEPGGAQRRWLVPQATVPDKPAAITQAVWNDGLRALSGVLNGARSFSDLLTGLRGEQIKPLLPLVWNGPAKPEPLDEDAVPVRPAARNFVETN